LERHKPFNIDQAEVMDAYKKVKANKGAAGVDQQSITEFEKDLENNLYKLWNRMASGSYFPPAVREVVIPKRSGGQRKLGIPTVTDRIAQQIVRMTIEPKIDKYFHQDSYGYRPNKQALDGIAITRKRCWKYEWLVEYDIKGLFDNIDHNKLIKVVQAHVTEKWAILYIQRWLIAPIQTKQGLKERTKGTPQGGVISPLLSNLFLHYAFDEWMQRKQPGKPWARYADDGIIHCRSKTEAETFLVELEQRLQQCGLEIQPIKTKIVHCGKGKEYPNQSFTFLGYEFRPRRALGNGEVFTSYLPAISKEKAKEIRAVIRTDNIRARVDLSLEQIAEWYNPKIRGWANYFGKFYPSAMRRVWTHLNKALVLWAQSKYKKLRTSKRKARELIRKIQAQSGSLFHHWKLIGGKEIYV